MKSTQLEADNCHILLIYIIIRILLSLLLNSPSPRSDDKLVPTSLHMKEFLSGLRLDTFY